MRRIIHCIWLGGEKTPLARRCRASWERFAPGWEIREWNALPAEVAAEVPAYVQAAMQAKKWAFVSDWLRFWVLAREGGLYFDYDVELVAPIERLPAGEWVAAEWVRHHAWGYNPGSGIALEAGSPLARQMLAWYETAPFDMAITVGDALGNLLGPPRETHAIRVLPPEVLSPIDWHGKCHRTAATIAIHHYALSWISWKRRVARWFSWHGLDWVVQAALRLRGRRPLTRPIRRVAIIWPGFTGYTGDCWRALAQHVKVKIWLEPSALEQHFDGSELAGLDWVRLPHAADFPAAVEAVRAFTPDVLLVCGWHTPLCRLMGRAKIDCRKVIAFDMPWEWRLRKFAAKLLLWPRLRHFDSAFVPGAAAARYARWLGFGRRRLTLGSNTSCWERFRNLSPAARGFLFVGRFVHAKSLDVLLAAYARYREQVADPWPLDLVGSGDLPVPAGEARVLGFVPPHEMPRVLGEHACLVLPSRWEPWGVCAAEAMSAGLMTILSHVCGLAHDVPPTRSVRPGRVDDLTAAMVAIHHLPEAARAAERIRVRQAMETFSAAHWAEHLLEAACKS